MTLKLSDVRLGIPSVPNEWSNRLQKGIPQDPKKVFIKEFATDAFGYKADNLPITEQYQSNYLEYLEKCWGDHLGVVITPDNVWYTLLCELAIIVKGNAENYRPLFSETKEKQTIIVISGDIVTMPLEALISALKDLVPTDVDCFLPKFSTSTERSQHAFHAAFCDMCSPYYNYGMLLCGIPCIDIKGTKEEWCEISNRWKTLTKIFGTEQTWFDSVQKTLDEIKDNLNNSEFWKKMFYLEHCGSGSQVMVFGWWTNFYLKQPSVRYSKNFSTHVSQVNYRQLNLGIDYLMKVGLFTSKQEGDFMVPDFGYIVYEKGKVEDLKASRKAFVLTEGQLGA